MTGSVKKEGNSWYYIVDIGKDELTGKRIQKKKRGFKTKKEASAALTEALNEINKGTYVKPNKTLYSLFLDEWLENKKVSVATSTYETYSWLVKHYIKKDLGHIELSKITPSVLQKYYIELLSNKIISAQNVQKIHSLISNSLKTAERWGLVHKNIALLVDRPKAYKNEMSVWTKEEVKDFLIHSKTDRLYIAFLLAITTGMRQGELLGLRWKDVNFEEGSISIVQTLSHDGKTLKAGAKTKGSVRKIYIPNETIIALKEHYQLIIKEREVNQSMYSDNDLVVCTSIGTPMNPRNLMRSFYRLIHTSGVSKIRFHDIRHTHATMLLMEGINPKIIADRLGHADVRMTLDTYSHLLPSIQKDVVTKIDKIFN